MTKRREKLRQHLLWPFRLSTNVFDYLEEHWEGPRMQRWVANILVISFVAALAAIEANRLQLLPEGLRHALPLNHFYAVRLAFDLLLVIEVLGLVFGLADSVANSMGKQFEILSLILLRQSFKEFVHFSEPLRWEEISGSVWHILSDAGGALLIFMLVLFYYRLQTHRRITNDESELASFVAVKKTIALLLLALFVAIAFNDAWHWWRHGRGYSFFGTFYLTLIFSDILIVLISLRYSKVYGIVFRNSGFAIATVLIRLALTAPPFINVLLGVAAVGLGLGLTLAYNYFALLPTLKLTEDTGN